MPNGPVPADVARIRERSILHGSALAELEPEVMDLDRPAYLAASHAQDAIPSPVNGKVTLAEMDCEAMLFGIFEMRRRIGDLRAAFCVAWEQSVDATPRDSRSDCGQ